MSSFGVVNEGLTGTESQVYARVGCYLGWQDLGPLGGPCAQKIDRGLRGLLRNELWCRIVAKVPHGHPAEPLEQGGSRAVLD